MYELKTKINDESVSKFLDTIEDDGKRTDCYAIIEMMRSVTGMEPKMWGTSIIGFGSYHYKYDSGHEGDTMMLGFSPRKANITIYQMLCLINNKEILSTFGKHKVGKGCLYINKLSDVNTDILKQMIELSYKELKERYLKNQYF